MRMLGPLSKCNVVVPGVERKPAAPVYAYVRGGQGPNIVFTPQRVSTCLALCYALGLDKDVC